MITFTILTKVSITTHADQRAIKKLPLVTKFYTCIINVVTKLNNIITLYVRG